MSDRQQDQVGRLGWWFGLAKDVAWFTLFALFFVPFLLLLQLYQRLSA